MADFIKFPSYLFVLAGTTYLIRMIPLVLVKKKIKNRFFKSFLYYIPYAVLGVMIFPAIFYSTSSIISALIGCTVAVILSFRGKNLIIVSSSACAAVLITEYIIKITA